MINLFLKAQGMTQQELAAKTGLSQSVISKLMLGGSCNVETLLKIAESFKVPTDEVLGRVLEKRQSGNSYHGPERRKPNNGGTNKTKARLRDCSPRDKSNAKV